MRTSGNTFEEVAVNLINFFHDVKEYNDKAVEKFLRGSTKILEI